MAMSEERRNAILAKAYRLLETPIEPHVSPEVTWTPPRQVKAYDAERLEQEVDKRLLAIEARFSLRMDALESNLASLRNGVEGLADEAGGAVGEVEKRLREEISREADALRNEVTLLRAQANTPARRQKPSVSRAPFRQDEDNAFRN